MKASGQRLIRMLTLVPSAPMGIGAALLLVTAGTLGLSRYLQDQMARHLIDKLLATQTQRIQEKVDRFDGTLRNAEVSVQRYASLLSHERLSASPAAAEFERTFHRDADGSWRVPRSRFDPHQDANAWIPPTVPLTDANKRFYLRALDVTRSFGQSADASALACSMRTPATAYHQSWKPVSDACSRTMPTGAATPAPIAAIARRRLRIPHFSWKAAINTAAHAATVASNPLCFRVKIGRAHV